MLWMRRQPDLRVSVLVKLAVALEIRPAEFLSMILRESLRPGPPNPPPPPSRPKVSPFSHAGVRQRRREYQTRQLSGSTRS
jgi:hypothetical protein